MKIALAVVALTACASAFAQTSVNGYIRSDGTYVAPHVRSSPNNIKYDNYGAKGNTNPYTGQRGTAPSELYPSQQRTPSGYSSSYPSQRNPYGR